MEPYRRILFRAGISVVVFSAFISSFALAYAFLLSSHFYYAGIENDPKFKIAAEGYLNRIENLINTSENERVYLRKYLTHHLETAYFARVNLYQLSRKAEGLELVGDMEIGYVEPDGTRVLYGYDGQAAALCYVESMIYLEAVDTTEGSSNDNSLVTRGIEGIYGSCEVKVPTENYVSEMLMFAVDSSERSLSDLHSEIVDAEQGIAEGLFGRMLYFSAVTATTLGYGDIVPVTGWTRFLVALESILGLIVMGSLVFWTTQARPRG